MQNKKKSAEILKEIDSNLDKEISAFLELLSKLSEEKQHEFYYMVKGAAVVAETEGV